MSVTTTRNRIVQTASFTGTFRTWSGPSVIASSLVPGYDNMIQRTVSEGHPFRRSDRIKRLFIKVYGKDIRGNQDLGGPFTTYKVESIRTPRRTLNLVGGNPTGIHWSYDGEAAAWDETPVLSPGDFLQPSSAAVLHSYGTTAIARCIPTNPLAGMGQFLGEIRDLPKVPLVGAWKKILKNAKRKTKHLDSDAISRGAADDYLNAVFGWAPFISDLEKFIKVAKETGPIMRKFAEGSNHLIHRSYHFPDESTTTTTVLGSGNKYPTPALNVYLWSQGGTLTKTETTVTKRWFKGAFTYFLPYPEPNDNGFVTTLKKWKLAEAAANRLFGLRLTPDLLYKVTPWSWALDWVSNTGDVIHNWSAFANDGLVMDYGYIMETKIREVTYSLTNVGSSNGLQNFVQTYRYTTKSRLRATPYGFGVNPASFTAKQWSIIAALGISKQPLSLNI